MRKTNNPAFVKTKEGSDAFWNIRLVKTRSGLPALWEESDGQRAVVIANYRGERIRPIYVKQDRALFVVNNNYFVIIAEKKQDRERIHMIKLRKIKIPVDDNAMVRCKEVAVYKSESGWHGELAVDMESGFLRSAVQSAREKLNNNGNIKTPIFYERRREF